MKNTFIKKALAKSEKDIDKTLSNIQDTFGVVLNKVKIEIDIETGNFKITDAVIFDNKTGQFIAFD